MRFLTDENFRLDVINFLRSAGHDVEQVAARTPDEAVADLLKKEKRILLTNDRDFSVTLNFPPVEYPGILIFRIHPPNFEKLRKAIKDFLTTRSIQKITGKTFLIEEDSVIELE